MADQQLTTQEEVKGLTVALEDRTKELKELEIQIQEREIAVRRAREEVTLLNELETINQLAIRKADRGGTSNLKVDDDTLQRIIGLEDAIKIADKKTQELQSAGDITAKRIFDAQAVIEMKAASVNHIKDVTGYERYNLASRGFTHEENAFRQQQKRLKTLEDKSNMLLNVTSSLTAKNEELTHEIEELRTVDEEIAQAKVHLADKTRENAAIQEEGKSLQRIHLRKKKLTEAAASVDGHKAVKQLEGDKRALHTDLMKCIDQKKSHSKAITAQDQRMRQIEGRLQVINAFLVAAFSGEGDCVDHRPQDLDENAPFVTLAHFEEVQNELLSARKKISTCDSHLDKLDAEVELREKQVRVLHQAVVSRTNAAYHDNDENEKDRKEWEDKMDALQQEFDVEFERLTNENEALRSKLAVDGGPQ